MIQQLASRYQKKVAFLLLLLNCLQLKSMQAWATEGNNRGIFIPSPAAARAPLSHALLTISPAAGNGNSMMSTVSRPVMPVIKPAIADAPRIGGPGQPEMSSFKPVSAGNLVNLFTGDFNYNIPLLDVGGYPVNIFYGGGIGSEQEASWVGLGWNLNPGTVSRNMRGVPDDFNGEDTLVQSQNMKPNKTWGASLAGDLEICGVKKMPKFLQLSLGLSLGASFNNYLGPALDIGVKGGVGFKIADKALSEKGIKDTITLKAGLSADINSRSGLTLSPNVSLTAAQFSQDAKSSFGIGLSTSYNSRSGIKALQLAEQVSFSKHDQDCKVDLENMKVNVQNRNSSFATDIYSTSISFARPSYIPAIRMPLTNKAFAGHFQVGGAIFGVYGSAELEVYQQTSRITTDKVIQKKPMVGYLYAENAMNNPNDVMDFTRFNDREVTPQTPIISVPQYTYDVFSIQGEGTGGSIRAYRSEPGYVRDNATSSTDESTAVGGDIGIPGHFGFNYNTIKTPSTISEWNANNQLHTALRFRAPQNGSSFENVYFRNPGEGCVLAPHQYDSIGGTDLVRFRLSGTAYSPGVQPMLDRFAARIPGVSLGTVPMPKAPAPGGRQKRTQSIDFLTADDASLYGLDKQIKSYDNQTILDPVKDTLIYASFPRKDLAGGYHKHHHISEINVTEANGRRYIYGIPVYNVVQKDFTFTVVDSSSVATPGTTDTVGYVPGVTNSPTANPAISGGTGSRDGYVQVTQTPAYAHSFLLTGLLSPDYQDLTGNGITEDDPGDAIKFNYTRIKAADGSPALHSWRTPAWRNKANFLAGKRSDVNDDKGVVSFGQRESWYLHSIESKTMIALFTLADRADAKGATNENGGNNSSDASAKLLQKIDLYSKADLHKNGLAGAKPIKTVNFVYSYRLCQGTPDNPVGQVTTYDNQGKGKLTLEEIYFTYNGQSRQNKDKYVFSYLNSDNSGNPIYKPGSSDRWGTYKPATMNPGGLLNSDYPYTPQEQQGQSVSPKAALDQNAGAWSLKKILLPSGGQIEADYESDDYAWVQNRRAADFLPIEGFGSSPSAMSPDRLYNLSGSSTENDYVFIRVPQRCSSPTEVYQKYLQGMDQLAVRLAVKMPKGTEMLTCYGNISSYGVYDTAHIWVKLKEVSGMSPLALTALEYLREQLPGQAFTGYDVSESSGLDQIGEMLVGLLDGIKNAFKDPVKALRSDGKARYVALASCFARVNDPRGIKYGGGHRVRAIRLKDNWQPMSGQYTSIYEQRYDYTTTEVLNGATRVISSGVATYEPSIGGDENPMQTIKQVADKLPLGPTSYGAIEMPVLDAFFPSPQVGYSKVTVRSPSNVTLPQNRKSRFGVGRQVTEFYTAKDYPVYYNNTSFDPSTDKQEHDASTMAFFYKYAYDSRALSQGFLVELNDMHGKLKAQTSYADNDTTVQVSRTEQYYRNTGAGGPVDQFDVVSAKGGTVSAGNIGIDVELMTDTREFSVKSSSFEIQAQADLFPVFFPFWIPFIWPVSGNSENTYRAVTTTKVVNYHSVLDSVVTIDKGSLVSAKNLLYDGETGEVIVKRVNNEFELPIYTTSYPAWWAYSGMSPAYRNQNIRYDNVNFSQGRITSPHDQSVFESGDELYLTFNVPPTTGCDGANASVPQTRIWVLDTAKNTSSLNNPAPYFIFIDTLGKPYTMNNVSLRIVRSGKRNMLDAVAAQVTGMANPIVTNAGVRTLAPATAGSVVNAAATEFREKWPTDRERVRTFKVIADPNNVCGTIEVEDCAGYLQKSVNPYRKGLLGNFRTYRNMVFYDNRTGPAPTAATNLPQNGFLNNFQPYWNFNGANNLVPNTASTQWVWNQQSNRFNSRGLELESQNALNIYTAAQYGYSRSMPTAVTNNARYGESIYEGFEDNDYNAILDSVNITACPNTKYFDFTAMANTKLVNTDTTGFNAHTGKFVLAVKPNATAATSMGIGQSANPAYNMAFGTNVAQSLYQTGGNANPGPPNGNPLYWQNPTFSFGTSSITVNAYPSVTNQHITQYTYGEGFDFYISLATAQTYNFNMQVSSEPIDNTLCDVYANYISVSIYDMAGNVHSMSLTQSKTSHFDQQNQSLFLCPGIYHIVGTAGMEYVNTHNPADSYDSYSWACTNCTSSDYKNLTTQNGCVTTVPIAGDASMLNPQLGVTTGKKMTISAWVRENQRVTGNGVTGLQPAYTHNSIQVYDGAKTTTLTPTGPIIDGWQRYEGAFTPVAATSISFINSNTDTLYLDDIRIHPFNAEMKSYVYDPVNLRLTAELDANNYATFYEYDEEGTLIRVKAETRQGIKTIKETRSAKQKKLVAIQ